MRYKEPVLVRYAQFSRRRWLAVSPLYGEQHFTTRAKALGWLYSLTCDDYTPSTTYYPRVCIRCGGLQDNHEIPDTDLDQP